MPLGDVNHPVESAAADTRTAGTRDCSTVGSTDSEVLGTVVVPSTPVAAAAAVPVVGSFAAAVPYAVTSPSPSSCDLSLVATPAVLRPVVVVVPGLAALPVAEQAVGLEVVAGQDVVVGEDEGPKVVAGLVGLGTVAGEGGVVVEVDTVGVASDIEVVLHSGHSGPHQRHYHFGFSAPCRRCFGHSSSLYFPAYPSSYSNTCRGWCSCRHLQVVMEADHGTPSLPSVGHVLSVLIGAVLHCH